MLRTAFCAEHRRGLLVSAFGPPCTRSVRLGRLLDQERYLRGPANRNVVQPVLQIQLLALHTPSPSWLRLLPDLPAAHSFHLTSPKNALYIISNSQKMRQCCVEEKDKTKSNIPTIGDEGRRTLSRNIDLPEFQSGQTSHRGMKALEIDSRKDLFLTHEAKKLLRASFSSPSTVAQQQRWKGRVFVFYGREGARACISDGGCSFSGGFCHVQEAQGGAMEAGR
jgi:hypothetical protein